jgi:hypothetical protein
MRRREGAGLYEDTCAGAISSLRLSGSQAPSRPPLTRKSHFSRALRVRGCERVYVWVLGHAAWEVASAKLDPLTRDLFASFDGRTRISPDGVVGSGRAQ